MSLTAFRALVRRDLRLFFQDRRALTMSFVAPIVIGSFFGYLFGGAADRPPSKIAVAIVDSDRGAFTRRFTDAISKDAALEVTVRTFAEAEAGVRAGKITLAAVLPTGFSDQVAAAVLRGGPKPEIQLLYDPSHAAELAMVRGLLAQHIRPGPVNAPFTVKEEAVTARKGAGYNSMAHAFAGMSVQFILFMGIDAGLLVLMQRRTGMWKRLQAAPLSRWTVIGARAASAAITAMIILAVVFTFARIVWGVKIEGSFPGFLLVCAAFSLMTAMFGLLVAVLGKTPEGARGISILATLLLVMLGGSWVPAFLFPQWLQKVSFLIPTRWAVDGLDGTIWRGYTAQEAFIPAAALLGFAALFGLIAIWRFKWES